MDLSFARFDRIATVTVLAPDLAVLMVGVAARQAASPTARVQARLEAETTTGGLLAPLDGAFSERVARMFLFADDPAGEPPAS